LGLRPISIILFYLYQRLDYRHNYFFKIKFAFFLYLLLSASWNENDLVFLEEVICYFIYVKFAVMLRLSINTVVSNHVNSDHVPSFSCLDVWSAWQTTSAISVTTSAFHSHFICIKDLTTDTITSLKLNLLSFFICCYQHHETKTICLYIFQISDRYCSTKHQYLFSRFPETNTWLNLQKIGCAVIWNYFRLIWDRKPVWKTKS
jgi:hypothetical protein